MSWYFVDGQGQTQGPLSLDQMKGKYASKDVKDETYIWNGTDVKDWTPLSNVPQVLKQMKPLEVPGPPTGPGPSAPRRNPMGGGGGNAALLASIRRGAPLRKVEITKSDDEGSNDASNNVPSNNVSSNVNNNASSSNNSATTAPKKPARQTVQEEMAARLRARLGGGGNAPKVGAPKTTSEPKTEPKTETKPDPKPEPKNEPKTLNSAPNKMTSQSSQKKLNVDESDQVPYSSNSSSSSNPAISSIIAKLENAEEWQLKAIEKILS